MGSFADSINCPTSYLQALSDAQQFLFEERQRLLLLQAENDELKLQEIQDRQRIQQLLALTQPVEQTVTYRQGGPPSSITAYPKPAAGSGSAAAAGRAGSPSKAAGRLGSKEQQHGSAAAGAGGVGGRVLRTVVLPAVDSDFLLLKIESLQAQLNEQVRATVWSRWGLGGRGTMQLHELQDAAQH
jgi:coiled-coil domain-containing protein 77